MTKRAKPFFSISLTTGEMHRFDTPEERIAFDKVSYATLQKLQSLLPGPYYMDPPDGGNVSVMEQLQRMADDARKWREHQAGKDLA